MSCLLASLDDPFWEDLLVGWMQSPVTRRTGEGKKTVQTGGGTREKKVRATSGSIIIFFVKELWGMVGDELFLAFPFSFVSWQTPCFAKQKMQNHWSCSYEGKRLL